MGVSQVNTNNVNIVKLALAKKGIKSGTKKVPEYLTPTGSIFKAPKSQSPAQTLADANTKYTLDDLKGKRQPAGTRATGALIQTKSKDNENSDPDVSVSGGKAALVQAQSSKASTERLTKSSEKGAKAADKFADNAKKTFAETQKNDKAFLAQYREQQNAIKRDNDRITKLIKENEEHEQELNDLQRELDEINSSSEQVRQSKASRVGEIKGLIGTKVGLLQRNGKSIYSLQRSQSRSLSKMNRVQIKYMKAQQQTAKQIDKQQNETSDILDIAQEAEKWSSITQSGGQALGLLGKLFVAIGSATSGFFGIGAALVSIGTVMQKVGAVVELVGQYGQLAANVTKTAAYAAEGNLMGAAMSVGSAIQSATACVKGTKGLKAEFGQINEQAQAATEKIAAKQAAKEAVQEATKGMSKDQAKEALGGMSEKQARKYMTADLQKQMQDKTINVDGMNFKEMSEQIKNTTGDKVGVQAAMNNAKKAYTNAQNTAQDTLNISSLTKNESGKYVTDTMKKDGKTAKTISQSKFNKTVNKNFKQAVNDIGVKKFDAKWGSNITALGNSVQNIASVLTTNGTMNSISGGKKKQLPPAQLDARTRRIMMKNQRYRAIRGYAA